MNAWQLAAAAGLYLWVAADYAHHGHYGMSFAFVAYAAANAGFILAARGF